MQNTKRMILAFLTKASGMVLTAATLPAATGEE
jgi:hypothetical protein